MILCSRYTKCSSYIIGAVVACFAATVNAAELDSSISRASGEDPDLGTFGGVRRGAGGEMGAPFENETPLENVLIVNEERFLVDSAAPSTIGCEDTPAVEANDDDSQGDTLEFDFSLIKGGGTVTVNSVTYIDNDEGEFGAQIEMKGPKLPASLLA